MNTRNDQKMPIKRFYYLDIAKVLNIIIDRIDTIISVDKNKKIGRDIIIDLLTPELEYKNKMIPFNIMTNSQDVSN